MFKKGKKIVAMALAAVMALSLCACDGKEDGEQASSGKTDTLKWYIMATEPVGFDKVMAEANKYIKEKLGVELELICLQAADYTQKMNMIMAAQEEFDMMWVNVGLYESNIAKGAFLPLDDYLGDTPELKALFEDGVWDATRVNGDIYGVPMLQVLYDQPGLWMIKSIVDKYSLDVENIKSNDDLAEIFQVVKENEPEVIPIRSDATGYFSPYRTEVGSTGFLIDEDGKVLSLKPEAMEEKRDSKEWYAKGFYPADVTTMTDEQSLIAAQKLFSRYSRQLPGVSGKFKNSNGYDVVNVALNDGVISRKSVQSTMTVISATSKNPEKAMALLELMQTDKYLFNLMSYGIEGEDWTKDPENENRILREDGAYYVPEYLIGNQFLAYILPNYEDTVWEETIAENEKAVIDPNNGFAFVRDSVETELTNLASIGQEFGSLLSYGEEPIEDVWAKYTEKRKMAGEDKVREEIQNQYDAWKATQK